MKAYKGKMIKGKVSKGDERKREKTLFVDVKEKGKERIEAIEVKRNI